VGSAVAQTLYMLSIFSFDLCELLMHVLLYWSICHC